MKDLPAFLLQIIRFRLVKSEVSAAYVLSLASFDVYVIRSVYAYFAVLPFLAVESLFFTHIEHLAAAYVHFTKLGFLVTFVVAGFHAH